MDQSLPDTPAETPGYELDVQVGFLLRRATQRHLAIFAAHIPDLTSTQFAALAKLCAEGPSSQNALGRMTAMDAATIKGVIDRLRAKGLVSAARDAEDQRRVTLSPTPEGRATYEAAVAAAHRITAETLAPLDEQERETFLALLAKLT
ncbi:MarR family winged helix-turn-helix transcriptional regulator [Acidimangrovimonas pyrenivorans]|uniref:MarR family winged helix-turn-helix transcriptional regulator n=1 Tax=Acidimangrovimonas pyrenivorans TaxID=2030798 RepID=A0ABV7AHD2_9RHOB